jgi:hypothetical protein
LQPGFTIEQLREAFFNFDTDRDGAISTEDLKVVLMSKGAKMSREEVRNILIVLSVFDLGAFNPSLHPKTAKRLSPSTDLVFPVESSSGAFRYPTSIFDHFTHKYASFPFTTFIYSSSEARAAQFVSNLRFSAAPGR